MRFFARSDGLERKFNRQVLPHLDSAYNVARWLLRNEEDAKDIVQEACLKAFMHLDSVAPSNTKAWFLTIVRNLALNSLRGNSLLVSTFEEEQDSIEWSGPTPEAAVLNLIASQALTAMLEELPVEFREVIVLKEIEELSYKEIAEVMGIPLGTVMSRLNRGRQRLRQLALNQSAEVWELGL